MYSKSSLGDPPYLLETFAAWRHAHAAHRPGDPPVLERRAGGSPVEAAP